MFYKIRVLVPKPAFEISKVFTFKDKHELELFLLWLKIDEKAEDYLHTGEGSTASCNFQEAKAHVQALLAL